MAALVTTADCASGVPGFSALTSTQQADLIAAASGAVEAACDRRFAAASYVELRRPGRDRVLYLDQYPVLGLTRLATHWRPVLTVVNADAAVSRASCVLGTTGGPDAPVPASLTLNAVAAGVAATPVVLSFATYPTLAALAVAVNAVSGWTAAVAAVDGGWACADLDAAGGAGTLGAKDAGAELGAFTRDADSYELDPESGRVRLHGRGLDAWFTGTWGQPVAAGGHAHHRRGRVVACYSAGFNPDPDAGAVTMPDELKRATLVLCQAILQRTDVGLKTWEQVTGYQYRVEAGKSGMLDLVADLIHRYRRRRLA